MTLALVKNQTTTIAVTDADTFQGGRYDNGGWCFFGDAIVGTSSGIYSVVLSNYTDAQPANSVQEPFDDTILAQWTVSNGTASGPRKWQTIAPVIPDNVTRAQALKALIYSGLLGDDPESTIAAAIAAVTDTKTRSLLRASFAANDWHRPDLIAECSLIGLTEAQVDALLVAADTY